MASAPQIVPVDDTALETMERGATMQADCAQPGASLTFKDLSFSVPQPGGQSKTILEPCSGHLEAGQLVALMGPSGSGKTTLLDMLAMKKSAAYEGQVFVNGHERAAKLFQRIAAYVGQEDKMPAHWKVREALEFNTFLKRQPGASRKQAQAMIDGLLESFGLVEVADTYIGGAEVRGISGGQRRRVSLARGVAAQASLLFADEPTSGLSATDAELCVRALRSIAKTMNVLVIVVIHQPRNEVAELFDTLLLLTSNPGRMAYLGPMQQAEAYFEALGHVVPARVNPTDFFLDLVTPSTNPEISSSLVASFDAKQRPMVNAAVGEALQVKGRTVQDMLQAAVDQGSSGHSAEKARLGRYAVPFHEQVRTLFKRKLRLSCRNPGAAGMQLVVPAGIGVVLGLIFQGIGREEFGLAHIEFLFILLTLLSLQALPMMPVLIDERGFMKYETSERLYTEAAHIVTCLCVSLPLSLLGAFLEMSITFAFSGMAWKYFGLVAFWCLLVSFVFDALFQCVAAFAPDAQQAQAMATPFLLFFMLFNGVVITQLSSPAMFKWIFEVCPTGYALQGMLLRIGGDAGAAGKLLLDQMHYRSGEDTKGIVVCLAMVVVFRLLQVAGLKFLNNVRR